MKAWHEAVGQYLREIGVDLSRCQLRDVCDALYATSIKSPSDWFAGLDGTDEDQARFHQALRERGWNEESIQANFGPRPVALNQTEATIGDWWA
jgi:hypothetical protein